ncbi:MAG: hypothetical protein WBJ84_04610 [Bacteroidales bacterium]
MEDLSVLISGIEFKLKSLTSKYKQLKALNKELEERTEEQKQIINHQNQLINQLQEKIQNINITKTLASRFEINDAKKRIGDMMREIDKCIDLLNK